ncbi:hypothetical protein E4G67_00860 [Candidatus Bathyarchaeota archaeon]|nr:MAG: hypothetical protein E4G67_00860 [Candidatus Bathyarchaeota archaeon]
MLVQINYPPQPRLKQERSHKKLVAIVTIIIIAVASVAGGVHQLTSNCSSTPPGNKKPFYVGVTFSGNTTVEAMLLIDRVKDYTNLLVLQSGPISKNETATNEICDYAVAARLSIVVYFGDLNPRVLTNETIWRIDWVNSAKQRWGERLLGVYYYDEPGGIWLDTDWSKFPYSFAPNSTYDSIAEHFISGLKRDPGVVLLKNNSIPIFVSDYALYWFDYLSGYDLVLAQLGWNNTVAQEIGLVRGASNLQEKSWGTIITWKYTESPYLANGEEIYDQMRTSYESGAEYIVIFNYAKNMNIPYGTLREEHFRALERFCCEVVQNPIVINGGVKAEAALVLPRNYGWGMRTPNDIIWGLWNTNSTSEQIWTQLQNKLSEYGSRLDIVYDDPVYPLDRKYGQIFYWNQTS